MTAIAYFSDPALGPGKHFECTKLRGTASVEWCIRQWREVNQQPEGRRNDPDRRDGRRHPRWVSCSGCPIGAEHAGVRVDQLPTALSEMRVCARCQRECNRIIRGYLCVSCYNREREYLIGRNAKGKPPIKHPKLFDVSLRVFDPTKPRETIRVIPNCASIREAILRVFMKSGPGVHVSVCPPEPIEEAAA